eukprot:TRINITY_DN43202_c0_g1_i1.p1 TRINITY_DN43202_c0_g1~~TRINITY_DN43202_c0_g1_i1.p1  ORF type:complete len:610 (-),score=162.60 TRINITY_DN43202_c0_g1_i1:101-1930(-)
MVWQLVPLHSSEEQVFQLPGEGLVTIGRRPNCSIVCRDISVSGKHCEVICRPGTSGQRVLLLVDCSSNGTYINDERIAKGDKAQLHDGDIISLSKPHPPGTNDGTVDPPPPRVQYRLDLRACEELESPAPAEAMPEERVPPTPARGAPMHEERFAPTQSDPPRRLATTAEGCAQELLVQEQLCKAKITSELLLVRRKLDEERNKNETLTRNLQKSKASLEETRSELSQLKDCQQKLQAAHASLQEKHDKTEVESIAQAQKVTSLNLTVQRLQEELSAMQSSNSLSQEKLAAAQEQLRVTNEEVSRLEGSVAEMRMAIADAQKESDRFQSELAGERSKKEGVEELIVQANVKIEELESKVRSSRQDAESERASAEQAKAEHVAAVQHNQELKGDAVRFADTLRRLVDKWVHGLPEVASPRAFAQAQAALEQADHAKTRSPVHSPARTAATESLAAPAREASASKTVGIAAAPAAPMSEDDAVIVEADAADCVVEATLAISHLEAGKEDENSLAEGDSQITMQSKERSGAAAVPSAPASAVAPADAAELPPAAQPPAPGPPQRLWSVSLLGATAGEVQESDAGSDASDAEKSPESKRRRISTGSAATASPT